MGEVKKKLTEPDQEQSISARVGRASIKTESGKITMDLYSPESNLLYHEVLTDINVVWILDGLLKDIASDTVKTMHSSMYDEHTYNTSIKPVFIQALFWAMQIVIAEAGCENELNPAILKDEKSLERFLGFDAVPSSVE